MAYRNATALILILVSPALMIGAGLALPGELSPYLAGSSPGGRFAAIASGSYRPAMSLLSKDLFFSDCLAVGTSIFAAAQPSGRRAPFIARCTEAARSVATTMRSYARPLAIEAALK